MLIDTHAHLNFQTFENDFKEVIKFSQDEGIEKIINVGADLDSSKRAVEIAQNHDCCYAAVGIHPHHADKLEKDWEEKLEKLANNPKVVAIGECGMDYHPYQHGGITNPQIQKEVFVQQLNLAYKLNLPVVLHCRDAHEDLLKIIEPSVIDHPSLVGVCHCFSGDENFLKAILKLGFYVGFDGNLTFKNAKSLQEIAKITPLERILLETDSPYLSPEPYRGLRNTPANVKIIAEFLARLTKVPFDEVCQTTSENAQKVFNKTR